MARTNTKAKKFALAAAELAVGRHCSNVVVLNLTDISPATDYFVIATGTSDRQMRTVADEISETARDHEFKRFGRAAVSIILAGIPAYFANEPLYLALAPVLQAIGKWLREKLGLNFVPI